MPESPARVVAERMRQMQGLTLDLARVLSDERLRWRANRTSPSIAFHVWHLARWADRVQAQVPGLTSELERRLGPGTELWDVEGLAERWGFPSGSLGHGQTGAGMSDEASERLSLPDKETLLDYAERSFAALDRAFGAIEDQFGVPCSLQAAHGPVIETTVGHMMTSHLSHVSRHLGMIECLRGIQGERGTASM